LISNLRLVLALTATALWLTLLTPFHLFCLVFYPRGAAQLPVLFHRGLLLFFGVKWRKLGRLEKARPLLVVANHVSWLDIVVLSAVAPLSFIAKDEMITWPLFGWLARMQRSIFINRNDRRQAAIQADEIARRLESGDVMVLFPEGTTTDGNRIFPFNSSLFGSAQAVWKKGAPDRVLIQPVALVYTRIQGMRMGRSQLPIVAWPGDVPLGSHLIGLLRESALDVEICFGEPISFDASFDRKDVAACAAQAVRQMRATTVCARPGEGL